MISSIHIHIPKTAGSTLKNIFVHQYGEKNRVVSPSFSSRHLTALKQNERENIDNLFGVYPFGLHELFLRQMVYTTIIRNPIDRMNSLYRYFCIDKAEGYYKKLAPEHQSSLKAFVENIDDYTLEHGNNAQTRLLAGAFQNTPWDHIIHARKIDDSGMLEQAIHNIQSSFVLVGTTEQFNDSILLFKKKLEWEKPVFYITRNVTKKKQVALDKETLDIIRHRNTEDIKLYNYVTERLEKEVKKNLNYLKIERRKLKINNAAYSFYRNNIRKYLK